MNTDYPWFAHYDAGVPRTLAPYPDRTLLDYIAESTRERPDHPAFLFKGRAFTLRELERSSDAFAVALAAMGVRRGDRVGIMLPNCPQFFIAELAAWKLGAVVAPFNPIYTTKELEGPLKTSGATVVIALTPFYERLKAVQHHTAVRRIITTNIKEYFPATVRLLFTLFVERKGGHRITRREGDLALDALLREYNGQRPTAAPPKPSDTALFLMSGGTTGTPKCVVGEHHMLVATGLQLAAWVKGSLEPWDGVFMLPLPLFHSYGACAAQSLAFIGHHPVALVPNPRDIDDIVKTLKTVRPAGFAGVPTLYNAMLNHPAIKKRKLDLSSVTLWTSGAAPLMAETKQRFEEMSGRRIMEGYSLTESLIAATVNPYRGATKVGSVGMPLPDVEVRIVAADNAAQEMPTGESGEILMRAPQIMSAYWQNPVETAQMVVTNAAGETWLHTADIGYLDGDGYLFVVDRKKDLIKPNGMQVWPRELEETIATHPAVLEVGVRGFPDAAHGEIAVAFVVLRPGAHATQEEIREYCKHHLAYYKVPTKVVFRTELPKSLIGKVLRRLLTLEEPRAAT